MQVLRFYCNYECCNSSDSYVSGSFCYNHAVTVSVAIMWLQDLFQILIDFLIALHIQPISFGVSILLDLVITEVCFSIFFFKNMEEDIHEIVNIILFQD